MTKSTIHIINSNYVDWDTKTIKVKYTNKVEVETHDAYSDRMKFRNVKSDEVREDSLINVSLFDDRIVRGADEFVILHMLTK